LYFAEQNINQIRRLTPAGKIEAVAGLPNQPEFCNSCPLGDEGPATNAYINSPRSIAFDPSGNLYVSTPGTIRKVTPDGTIHAFAGYGGSTVPTNRGNGGPALAAQLGNVGNIASDQQGRIYVYESIPPGGWMWRIDTAGIITGIVGTSSKSGSDGPAAGVILVGGCTGLVVSVTGVYFCDANRLRELTTDALVTTLVGGAPKPAPDGSLAKNTWLANPTALALDHNGNLLIAESAGCTVRKVGSDGVLTTVAGTGKCATSAPGGNAGATDLPWIDSMVVDSQNRIFFFYSGLRMISPDGTISAFGSVIPSVTQAIAVRLAIDSKDRIYVGFISVVTDGSLFRASPDGAIQALIDPWRGDSIRLYAIATDSFDNYFIAEGFPKLANGPRNLVCFSSAGTACVGYKGGVPGGGTPGDGTYMAVDPNGIAWTTSNGHLTRSDSSPSFGFGLGGDGSAFVTAATTTIASQIFAANGDMYFIDQGSARVRTVTGAYPQKPPAISPNGVVNAASLSGGGVAPGELISIFGTDFGSPGLDTAVVRNNVLPYGLSNVNVYFNGAVGVITARTPNQINVFVPYSAALYGSTSVSIVVDADRMRSAAVTVPLVNAAPGLVTADSSGSGQGAILNQDGSLNNSANPAARGSVITLFGTGEGASTPMLQDGALVITQPFPRPVQNVSVTVGGQPAEVLYAGSAPSLAVGVLQLNVRIPEGLNPGNAPVVLTVGSISTATSVTVAVR
jgi:uncharacterized protein (TIGR03437 family)